MSANQTVTKDTVEQVELDTVDDDSGGMASGGNALTIRRTGKYTVKHIGNFVFHVDVAVFRGEIRRNGVVIAHTTVLPAPGLNTHYPVEFIGELQAGDVIDCTAQYSGALPTPATLTFNKDSVFLSVSEH